MPTTVQSEPACPAHERFIESTWYTRIDYFHWNERFAGADFVNEDGPFWTLGYLFRLRQRMDKRGFSPDDPLYQLVVNAYDALHPLTVELHYLSCKEGVGRSQGR